jgi:hypothetical protein
MHERVQLEWFSWLMVRDDPFQLLPFAVSDVGHRVFDRLSRDLRPSLVQRYS